MNFEEKYQKFEYEMTKSPFELPEDIYPCFKKALISAGFDTSEQVVSEKGKKKGNSKSKGSGKVSGYNLFVKETMTKIIADGVPISERMGKIGQLWGNLDEEEKNNWNTQAKNLPVNESVDKIPKQKKQSKNQSTKDTNKRSGLSAYQIFVKDKMSEIASDSNIRPQERMAKIASIWKSLSPEEQKDYKNKADSNQISDASIITE